MWKSSYAGKEGQFHDQNICFLCEIVTDLRHVFNVSVWDKRLVKLFAFGLFISSRLILEECS